MDNHDCIRLRDDWVNYEACVEKMDPSIYEELEEKKECYGVTNDQEFVDVYCIMHAQKFNEYFIF